MSNPGDLKQVRSAMPCDHCKDSSVFTYSVSSRAHHSRGGDVVVYVFDMNQPSWPTPFYSVLESISVFMAVSTVFHSLNSPDNSHSVLAVLFLPFWSFQLHIFL